MPLYYTSCLCGLCNEESANKFIRRSECIILVAAILMLSGCNSQRSHANSFDGIWYDQAWGDSYRDYISLWAVNNNSVDSRRAFRRALISFAKNGGGRSQMFRSRTRSRSKSSSIFSKSSRRR